MTKKNYGENGDFGQTYSYNAANLVASASSKNSSVTYRYDLGGQQIGATWNDKRKTVNAYDAKGQLVSEQSTKTTTTGGGGTEIMSETDEPLVSGSIESMNVTGNSSDANRIIDRPFPTRPIITPPPYNTISPILPPRTKTITYYDNTYTYDSRGNRTSMTPASSGDAETYSYDLNNRLLNKAVGSVTTTYTYDSNGNMLSEKEGAKQATTYGYNAFNQLTSVSGADASAEYSYLPNGLRCEKVVDDVTTMQVWDGDQLVAEATPGKLSVYIYGMGLVAQSVRSGAGSTTTTVSYFMDDGMGNILCTTSDSSDCMYDAFGQRHDSLSVSSAFGYRGQYLDTETGNYYLRARYYDPALGRFTQQDSHWNVSNMVYGDSPSNLLGQDIEPYAPRMGIISQAGNLYVYCINNPIMYSDPGGQDVYYTFNPNISASLGFSGAIGPMVMWDDQGNLATVVSGYYGSGTPNASLSMGTFSKSSASNIFEFVYGTSMVFSISVGPFTGDLIMGTETNGKDFSGWSISASGSLIPFELHTGISFATINELHMYNGQIVPSYLTADYFDDLNPTLRSKLLNDLGIDEKTSVSSTYGAPIRLDKKLYKF